MGEGWRWQPEMAAETLFVHGATFVPRWRARPVQSQLGLVIPSQSAAVLCLLHPGPWLLCLGAASASLSPSPRWRPLVAFGLALSPGDGPENAADASTGRAQSLVPAHVRIGRGPLLVPRGPEPPAPLPVWVQQGVIKYSCHCCQCLQGIPPDLATPPPRPPSCSDLTFAIVCWMIFLPPPPAISSQKTLAAERGGSVVARPRGCVPREPCAVAPQYVPDEIFFPLPVPRHVPEARRAQAACAGSVCRLTWHLGRRRHRLTSAAGEVVGTENWQRARGELAGCRSCLPPAACLPASASLLSAACSPLPATASLASASLCPPQPLQPPPAHLLQPPTASLPAPRCQPCTIPCRGPCWGSPHRRGTQTPGKVWLPRGLPGFPHLWVLLPGVSPWSPPQPRSPPHAVAPTLGTRWYRRANSLAGTGSTAGGARGVRLGGEG